MRLAGRKRIYTDVPVINEQNILEVLRKAYSIHETNARDCKFLDEYERGIQPLQRIKTVRPEINIVDIDNVASEITDFARAFDWGNPITFIQNGTVNNKTEAIALLNQCYELDNAAAKTDEIGRSVEITGVCNELIDINNNATDIDNDSPFVITPLSPETSFCVYSSYYQDRRKMCGVTYRVTDDGKYFTVITPDLRFEIQGADKILSVEANPFGIINIVEWVRDCDLTGRFERLIDEMDSLNILESDFVNDVDQNTQSMWHANDVEFDTDENGNVLRPKSGDWLATYTAKDGRAPFIKPLAIPYEYQGILSNVVNKRALILQKAAVPQRNDNSGGSTGIAMSDATGWSAAENVANKLQTYQEMAKMEEAKVILAIIKESPLDIKLLEDIKLKDLKPNIKRLKTYELTTKINAIATGLSHGIDGETLFAEIPLFADPNEAWLKSKEMVTAYQLSVVSKDNEAVGGEGERKADADKTLQDESDQKGNSPVIDTNKTN